jgi:hypothetical protein
VLDYLVAVAMMANQLAAPVRVALYGQACWRTLFPAVDGSTSRQVLLHREIAVSF